MKKKLFFLISTVFALSLTFVSCNGGSDKNVPVSGLSLNKTTLVLDVGKTETLTASITPGNATNKNVTWTSSNNAIATVTGSSLNATITAITSGTETITVTTADGNRTATCNVTVTTATTQATWASVSAGEYHTIALKTDGSLWA